MLTLKNASDNMSFKNGKFANCNNCFLLCKFLKQFSLRSVKVAHIYLNYTLRRLWASLIHVLKYVLVNALINYCTLDWD